MPILLIVISLGTEIGIVFMTITNPLKYYLLSVRIFMDFIPNGNLYSDGEVGEVRRLLITHWVSRRCVVLG